jgi:hypothetical protein
MKLQQIGVQLAQVTAQCEGETLNMGAYQIAEFLRVSGEALISYIHNSNNQIGKDAEGHLNSIEIEKIHSIFKELSDNFFPMAHTNEPLRKLKIVETDKYRLLENFLHQFKQIDERKRDLNNDFLEFLRNFNNQ